MEQKQTTEQWEAGRSDKIVLWPTASSKEKPTSHISDYIKGGVFPTFFDIMWKSDSILIIKQHTTYWDYINISNYSEESSIYKNKKKNSNFSVNGFNNGWLYYEESSLSFGNNLYGLSFIISKIQNLVKSGWPKSCIQN